MEHTKLNNQKGFTMFTLILSIGIGLFITISVVYMFSSMLTADMEQQRYNKFLADKDKFFLELEETLAKADTVEVSEGEVDLEEDGIYAGTKKYTTVTTTKIYNDGMNQIQEIYQATDSGEYVTTTNQKFQIGDNGKMTLVGKSAVKYSSLTDLYTVEAKEFCFSESNGSLKCEPISNLLDVILYSEGVGGKSPEFNSRRMMYYAEG